MQYALLWSRKQNCFHIEPFAELLEKNTRAFKAGRFINDYHPIYVGSRENCDKAAGNSRHLLIERESA